MSAGRSWRLALPMYNVTPELARTWESFLALVIAGLRQHGRNDRMEVVAVPDDLTALWSSPDVLLTQTCGYPLVTHLQGRVQVVGTLQFTAPGCDGYHYRSAIVVSEAGGVEDLEALRGRVAVVNQPDSHSGMNALRHLIAPLARDGVFFSRVWNSGSHLASIAALQRGEADVAAIDCITWHYARQYAPDKLKGLRMLQFSAPAAGLPLIASATVTASDIQVLRQVAADICVALPPALHMLAINGLALTSAADYAGIVAQEAEAVQAGYPRLT